MGESDAAKTAAEKSKAVASVRSARKLADAINYLIHDFVAVGSAWREARRHDYPAAYQATQDYPFAKDIEDMVTDLVKWRDNILTEADKMEEAMDINQEMLMIAEEVKEAKSGEQAGKKLLKSLSKQLMEAITRFGKPRPSRRPPWRGQQLVEIPMYVTVRGKQVEAILLPVPPESRQPRFMGDPEAGIGPDPGEIFKTPEGHNIYAWAVKVDVPNKMDPDDPDPTHDPEAQEIAREAMVDTIKDLSRKIDAKKVTMESFVMENPDDEKMLIAVAQGVVTSPMAPDEIHGASGSRGAEEPEDQQERSVIRSIIPPEAR